MSNSSPRILVIEDNDEHCHLFDTLLTSEGYIVDCARTAIGVHELLLTTWPDLVICDLGIYGLADFGVLALLDADEKHRGLPVLFCTARDTRIIGPRLTAPGRPRTALLAKPFDIEVLLEGARAPVGGDQFHQARIRHRLRAVLEQQPVARLGGDPLPVRPTIHPQLLMLPLMMFNRQRPQRFLGPSLPLP